MEAVLDGVLGDGIPWRFCIALSGGLDSTVLAHALSSIDDRDLSVRAVHVDHGLHADASLWRDGCSKLCAGLGVAVQTVEVEVDISAGRSVEAAARQARYLALERNLMAAEVMLTAHHEDDQLETVLLQLFRGSGPAGLAGMPVLARFGPGWHCRPLLGFTRSDLEAYAMQRGLTWLEDPSNRDTGFDRNHLRHRVLPAIRMRWPSAANTVSRSARLCAEAKTLMETLASIDLGVAAEGARLRVKHIKKLPPGRQRNLLRFWLARRAVQLPDSRRLQTILDCVLTAGRDTVPEVRWCGGAVRSYRRRLYALDSRALDLVDNEPAIHRWEQESSLPLGPGLGEISLVRKPGRGLDVARFEGRPLTIRWRQGGERIRPVGRCDRKTLKKLFQEAGVVPWMRDRVPLVFDGETLVAVADLWVSSDASPEDDRPGLEIRWDDRPEIF